MSAPNSEYEEERRFGAEERRRPNSPCSATVDGYRARSVASSLRVSHEGRSCDPDYSRRFRALTRAVNLPLIGHRTCITDD